MSASEQRNAELEMVNKVKDLFLKRLANGDWVSAQQLEQLVPDELAEKVTEKMSPDTYEGCGRLVCGKHKLCRDALEALAQDGVCDKRTENGRAVLRLKQTTADTPGTPAGDPADRDRGARPEGKPKPKAKKPSTPSARAANPAQPPAATVPVEDMVLNNFPISHASGIAR
jgi:hypothetical protein